MALRTAALVPVPSLGFCPRSCNGSLTLLVTLPVESIVSLSASNHCVNSGKVAAVVMICYNPLMLLFLLIASHGTGNPRVPLALAPQITDHRSSQASHVGSTSTVVLLLASSCTCQMPGLRSMRQGVLHNASATGTPGSCVGLCCVALEFHASHRATPSHHTCQPHL